MILYLKILEIRRGIAEEQRGESLHYPAQKLL
jgi:hypothetical protein